MAVPFQEIVETAMREYSQERWQTMAPKERSAIIYRQMRRMDAEVVFGDRITQKSFGTGNNQVTSKVMIVEDDLRMAGVCEEMLNSSRYNVCGIARTVSEALALAIREEPSLALIDVRLDGEFSIDIARQLQGFGKLGVLYSIGNITTGALNRAGNACLAKPYESADLIRALEIVSEMVASGTASPPFPRNFQVLPSAFTAGRGLERMAC